MFLPTNCCVISGKGPGKSKELSRMAWVTDSRESQDLQQNTAKGLALSGRKYN